MDQSGCFGPDTVPEIWAMWTNSVLCKNNQLNINIRPEIRSDGPQNFLHLVFYEIQCNKI